MHTANIFAKQTTARDTDYVAFIVTSNTEQHSHSNCVAVSFSQAKVNHIFIKLPFAAFCRSLAVKSSGTRRFLVLCHLHAYREHTETLAAHFQRTAVAATGDYEGEATKRHGSVYYSFRSYSDNWQDPVSSDQNHSLIHSRFASIDATTTTISLAARATEQDNKCQYPEVGPESIRNQRGSVMANDRLW